MFSDDIERFPTRFRESASRGPYLWDWGNECGLKGAGFAPTSMGGHHFITRAALQVLPEVTEWLHGEALLLTWCYCGFPDMNWAQYGTFGTEAISARMPDTRREWEISRYCQYNQLLDQGHFIGHHPDQAIEGLVGRYEDACRAVEEGRGRDAIRFLGAAIHYLEDSGSPPHAGSVSGPYHMPAESLRDVSGIGIDGYVPTPSGDFQETVDELAQFGREQCGDILALLEAGRADDVLPFQVACANRCARAVADLLIRFYRDFASSLTFGPALAPTGVELLDNGDFSRPGDAPFCPDGWVMYWENRADPDVSIERRDVSGVAEVVAERVSERVACVPTWPRVVRCAPGQPFRLVGEVVCDGGEAGLEILFTDDATRPVSPAAEETVQGEGWQTVVLDVVAPKGTEILRPGVFARGVPGAARFRRLSLTVR
ncbi:MAG: hypothetical protein HN742_00915 [Lentisphaerae bacterium]|jgi:hypothetical protein|nr:hypothetical protein [Lentisphaerota bacterium]MBT5606357.1 hypothetical protein [Lentisphaerota bacterium]MBT7056788.1 hypothetical protein [Lentisphaerota bacterium]MBT7840393.1 hypothetical protein [Lentisphaerota bacterium]